MILSRFPDLTGQGSFRMFAQCQLRRVSFKFQGFFASSTILALLIRHIRCFFLWINTLFCRSQEGRVWLAGRGKKTGRKEDAYRKSGPCSDTLTTHSAFSQPVPIKEIHKFAVFIYFFWPSPAIGSKVRTSQRMLLWMSTKPQDKLMRLIRISIGLRSSCLPACRRIPEHKGFFLAGQHNLLAPAPFQLPQKKKEKKKKLGTSFKGATAPLPPFVTFPLLNVNPESSHLARHLPLLFVSGHSSSFFPPHHPRYLLLVRKFLAPSVTCFVIWILWWWQN